MSTRKNHNIKKTIDTDTDTIDEYECCSNNNNNDDDDEEEDSSSSSSSSSIDNAMFGGLDFTTTLNVITITDEIIVTTTTTTTTTTTDEKRKQDDNNGSSSSEQEKDNNNNNNNNNNKRSSCNNNIDNNNYRQRVDELLKLQYHDDTLLLSKPQPTESDFHDLFDWVLSYEGSNLDGIKCGSDKYGGYTLFPKASSSISKEDQVVVIKEGGEILAILPRKLRIGQNYACQQLNLPIDTPTLSSLTLLILDMFDKKHPYARCLPKQIPLDIFDISKLQRIQQDMGLNYYDECIKLKSRYEACAIYIKEYLSTSSTTSTSTSSTLDDDNDNNDNNDDNNDNDNNDNNDNNNDNKLLYWAMSMVKSRTHSFGSKGYTTHFWITPIFGLVNHSTKPNCQIIALSDGSLALKSLRPISSKEEITIDYQVDDDTQLYATYGFSLSLLSSKKEKGWEI